MNQVRIAFLHLAPRAGEIEENQQLIEQGIALASNAGARWILTPELATTGYSFADLIGTDWITIQPDAWVRRVCELARRHAVAILLAHVERDATDTLHNTMFAISEAGNIVGRHRKINALRVGSEAWSTPGVETTVVDLSPCGQAGLMICADAYSPRIVGQLKQKGARVLLSSAAWAPGLHGPDGEWERATEQTGLPIFVCNRTGEDQIMSFMQAESVVAHRGRRLLSMASPCSTVFVVDWCLEDERLMRPSPLRLDLGPIRTPSRH